MRITNIKKLRSVHPRLSSRKFRQLKPNISCLSHKSAGGGGFTAGKEKAQSAIQVKIMKLQI